MESMQLTNKLSVLDLFSGSGGFSLGLHRTGKYQTVAFCECDPYCQADLRRHWPEAKIFDNVKLINKKYLLDQNIKHVYLITAGFPCQDLSFNGRGLGLEGARSGLWSEAIRIIAEMRPQYAIVENVSALLQRGMDVVLADIYESGYDATWQCLQGLQVGSPQRRDRVWIVLYPRKGKIFTQRLNKCLGRITSGTWEVNHAGSLFEEWVAGKIEFPKCGTLTDGHLYPTKPLTHEKIESMMGYSFPYYYDEAKLWPTPTASDWKGVGPLNSKSHKHRLEHCYLDATIQEVEQKTGTLNPEWVEVLMGYPVGWTLTRSNIEKRESLLENFDFQGFPVSPGEPQNNWEPSRLIEKKSNWHNERIKMMGNSVIPQIPQLIAYYILELESQKLLKKSLL